MRNKIYHLHPSKRKNAMLIVVALFLISVGMCVAIDPLNIKSYSENTHVYWGLFLITIGSVAFISALIKIIMNDVEIIISDKGIEPMKWRKGIIPWDHIRDASINSWRYMFYLSISIKEDNIHLYNPRDITASRTIKKLGFGDINIPVSFLNLSQSEINTIIRDHIKYR